MISACALGEKMSLSNISCVILRIPRFSVLEMGDAPRGESPIQAASVLLFGSMVRESQRIIRYTLREIADFMIAYAPQFDKRPFIPDQFVLYYVHYVYGHLEGSNHASDKA